MGLFFGNNIVPLAASNIKYGRLYNWFAVSNANFATSGWHIPSQAEFETLENYLGGESVAGGKLKEIGTIHWNTPNEGATNDYLFNAYGSGSRFDDGSYISLKDICNFRAIDESLGDSVILTCYVNTASILIDTDFNTNGYSVRLLADTPGDWANGDTVTDYDGNIYTVIIIGTQAWLQQNWSCTKLNDGTPIPNVTVDLDWAALTTLAYCNYDNDINNVFI